MFSNRGTRGKSQIRVPHLVQLQQGVTYFVINGYFIKGLPS